MTVARMLLFVTVAGVSGAAAQTTVRAGANLQTQFSTISGDSTAVFNPHGGATTLFEARRLRIQLEARIGDAVTAQLTPDFAGARLRLATAWVRVVLAQDASSGVGLTFGQEKKPFNRYQQISSTTLVSIERGARLRGVANPATQDNLLIANGYAAQDIGASADAWLLRGRLTLKAGLYNGSGESVADVNNAKTWGGRVAATIVRDRRGLPLLRVGTSYIARDRAVIADSTCTTACAWLPDSSRSSTALGVDLEWGDFRPGLHVVVDAASGDHLRPRWRYDDGFNVGNLRPGAPDSAFTTFRAAQAVVSWRTGTWGGIVRFLEPALRVDLTDPDIAAAGDAGLLVTPVLNVHFASAMVMRLGVDWYRYRDAGTARTLRAVRLSWQTAF